MGFESFPTKKEKSKNESDEKLEKHKENERLSIEPINDLLVELSEAENTEELIQLFNERAKTEDVEHLRGCLIETCQNTLLMIDKDGKLKEFACDSDSKLLELHKYIKEFGEHLKGNNTFLLADELFKRSEGKIDAYKYFVKDSTESMERGELFEYINNPDNWIPLRAEMQEALFKLGIERAIKQSERLNDDVPTIHAYRGNTASGKSTMVRRDPSLAHALNEEGELDGAINPDIQKEQAQNWHMENGKPYGTTSQLHMEGGMISHKIKQDLLKRPELSLVMDQRFNTEEQIDGLLKTAERFNKEVRILDIECPLEVSLIRVLARSVNEPRPPFDAITQGFDGIRKSRKELIY